MRIPVVLDANDMDCCLSRPSVGDAVRWSLAWHDEPTHPAALEVRWLTSPVRLSGWESRHVGVESGTVLTRGPLAAWWPGDERSVPDRGVLMVHAHGFVPEAVPGTRGRAREVAVLIELHRQVRLQHWEPVPELTTTWPMADGDDELDWDEYTALAGPVPADHERRPGGALVVVDVHA